MQYVTPLRYPGGKGRLTQVVIDILRANNLVGGQYVEPYAGGAAIAISLLTLEYASHVHINDLNRSIYAFWKSVLEDTEALCRLISSKRISIAEWRRQRAVQSDPDASPLELAYSTFFLNRCNRSGIILGGVIGGKNQDGPWKLNARFNKTDLISRVEWIATLGHRITLHNLDAAELIDTVLPTIPRRSLIYLDPPYYVKGKGLYEDHYQHEDHAVIADKVKRLAHPWIVSYDNTPQICEIYSGVRHRTFGLRYSAQARYEGSEIMFFSNRLAIPEEIVPSRAHAA
jgi:DNA adenine methylase